MLFVFSSLRLHVAVGPSRMAFVPLIASIGLSVRRSSAPIKRWIDDEVKVMAVARTCVTVGAVEKTLPRGCDFRIAQSMRWAAQSVCLWLAYPKVMGHPQP